MQNLPTAEVYEKEFQYMPWGRLIKEVLANIALVAPKGGKVLDLMCGPSYLLGNIYARRPDLSCHGVDWDEGFIDHARRLYPNVSFEIADINSWQTEELFDIVVCTAGLHHLPHDRQEAFIGNVARLLKPQGEAYIGDPYIDDYSDEISRKIACSQLGYEYLVETIKNGGEDDVIKAAIDVLSNDVFSIEFKTSVSKITTLFGRHFQKMTMMKTWPDTHAFFGDYYFVLESPRIVS